MRVSTTAERLKDIMNKRNLRQIDVLRLCDPYCKKYGIRLAKNDLSQYLSGKAEPKQDKLTILGMALGIDEVWLMGYDVAASSASNLTPEGYQIGLAYDNADYITKRMVERSLGLESEKEKEEESCTG